MSASACTATNGSANTGGGGGGAGRSYGMGGSGGSGIVIVRHTVEPLTAANETAGRQAILEGIQASVTGGSYTASYDRQVYIRIANGSQYHGRFDVFVQAGSKRWAFNYDHDTTAEFPVFANITPVFYVWQGANMTNTSITGNGSALINSAY